MIKKIAYSSIYFLLLLITSSSSIYFYSKSQETKNPNYVVKVIDGDTFFTASAKKIRLREVNTPEAELCGSSQATKRLEQLILNKTVDIRDTIFDHYGREVGLVYVDKIFVNEVMLREGLGRQESMGSSQTDLLKIAHQRAFDNKQGIYSPTCRAEKPDKPNCLIKGNTYPNGKNYYHFPSCDQYNQVIVEKDLGENWFCTEKEAQDAGYLKAPGCTNKTYKN